MRLSYVSGEKGKDHSNKELVTPWFKFLWETYNIVLVILRNNSKLMALYAIVQYPLEYPEKFEKFGMTPSRESLFYDLPGAEVKEIIPVICAFYDMYLDVDADTLAWLFATDGMFLIDQLDAYSHHSFAIRSKRFDHARESDSTFHVDRNPKGTIRRKCLGQSLASNTRKVNFTDNESDGSDPSQKDVNLELLEAKKETVEEIKVPSVSELHEISRVKFRLYPGNKGIRNISFINEKERFGYLPLITLNACLEVILKNLVAYENLMAKNSFTPGFGLELAEYVDFMCGIIDTIKDVRLLREEKIIEGNLGDAEIVKLFNETRRCHGKMSVESELWKTVDQLNKVYESSPRVWVQSLVEN
ncbi:putative UPF0481 protein [Tanacetum coccineum]